jgi:hypothetical protein
MAWRQAMQSMLLISIAQATQKKLLLMVPEPI